MTHRNPTHPLDAEILDNGYPERAKEEIRTLLEEKQRLRQEFEQLAAEVRSQIEE